MLACLQGLSEEAVAALREEFLARAEAAFPARARRRGPAVKQQGARPQSLA